MKQSRRNHSSTLKARIALEALRIDAQSAVTSMRQCELLAVCRSSLHYQPQPVAPADLHLMRRIDELHLAHPFLGTRRLARMLQREGI